MTDFFNYLIFRKKYFLKKHFRYKIELFTIHKLRKDFSYGA